MKFRSIIKVAAAVMAACGLILTSCDKPEEQKNEVFELSLKNSKVGSGAGQQFVNVKCSGDWTLTLVAETGEVDWARLSATSGTGNKSNVILSYDVNADEQDRSLKIYLDNGSKSVYCDFSQLGSGKHPEDDPDTGGDNGSGDNGSGDNGSGDNGSGDADLTETGWLELPAMDNPAMEYYAHHFKMNGKTYRNYSFGWSQKDRVALWVAYPLCKLYTNGNVGRTNAWALDPLLGNDSAAPFGGYAGNYARGHQLPSADRQCCYDANAQTFYGTNMTPQLNEHNEQIWADLESKVRGYANTSDTTYVVTGVIVSPSSKKEKDSYGQSVTIPDAYFKAVLKYSKSSTLGAWNAAAFYLEHRAYSGSVSKEHSMSIDELEEMTGIDFFVNLPAKIGADQAAKLEAADPANSSVWW
jgi:DNA/RNA endonuclease G (NUC1)